ncbi:MAG: hypothetical protein ACREXX_20165 [Gammaproteobacteria bacterium]
MYTTNAGVPKTPSPISWFKNTSRPPWPKSEPDNATMNGSDANITEIRAGGPVQRPAALVY